MGNRAIITTQENRNLGIYLHWNGGRASVEGFLQACKELDYRSPDGDSAYGFARLAQVIGMFFGKNGLSVGIVTNTESPGDNGVYLVGGDWEIVGREDAPDFEEKDEQKTKAIKEHCVNLVKNLREYLAKDGD